LAGPKSAELAALWTRFNGDSVVVTFLLIYIVGHLLSAVLIAIMLGQLRLIPASAAWAFALTSPLTMIYYMVHTIDVKYALRFVIYAVWIAGAIPAAVAMLKAKDVAQPAESTPLPAQGEDTGSTSHMKGEIQR
jgi:hypothetical protein